MRLNNTPLLSVIVPIYNQESYLNECLDSIICQTYPSLEIILVNDGSTDNSLEICKLYQQKDERIIIISQENQGVSKARNVGLDHSLGEYITFVDPDDRLLINTYEENINYILKYKFDVIQFPFIKLYNSSEKNIIEQYEEFSIENTEVLFDYYYRKHIFRTYLWNKIYEKSIFDGLRFPENLVYEDRYLMCEIVKRIRKFGFSNKGAYIYRIHSNQITKSSYNKHIIESLIIADLNIIKNIRNYNKLHDIELERYANCIYYNNVARKEKIKINDSIIYELKKFRPSLRNTLTSKAKIGLIIKCLFS